LALLNIQRFKFTFNSKRSSTKVTMFHFFSIKRLNFIPNKSPGFKSLWLWPEILLFWTKKKFVDSRMEQQWVSTEGRKGFATDEWYSILFYLNWTETQNVEPFLWTKGEQSIGSKSQKITTYLKTGFVLGRV
jgi:hypothetical protein